MLTMPQQQLELLSVRWESKFEFLKVKFKRMEVTNNVTTKKNQIQKNS